MQCDLCDGDGGALLVSQEKFRVVAVEGADGKNYQGFCRVIWNDHVREMTDLVHEDRALFMNAVFRVESALRLSLNPDKINLASLGNMTPHLHWHVIPRYANDVSFPKPIWAATITPAITTNAGAIATLDDITDWKGAIRASFRKAGD